MPRFPRRSNVYDASSSARGGLSRRFRRAPASYAWSAARSPAGIAATRARASASGRSGYG